MGAHRTTAVILLGGGMRSAHGAGFLYALAKELGITKPRMMIGSSGDAGNILYFSSGQCEGMRRIWTELLSTPKFISPLRFWRMMDIDYLVDEVFKKQEPLDTRKLRASGVDWRIPITNYDTGISEYIGARDGLDQFEVLRATMALPVFFGKKIFLSGKRYIDGEIGPTLEDHIMHALEQGADRILAVNHSQVWTPTKRFAMRVYASSVPEKMHDAIIRDISSKAVHIRARGVEMISISPHNLPAGTVTRDKEKLLATFEMGEGDCLAVRKEIGALFGS